MARPKTSILRRILLQTDCGFWCIHDHLDVLAFLGLPTLAVVLVSALGLVGVWRAFELPWWVSVLGAGAASFRLWRFASSPRCRCRVRSSPGRRRMERPRQQASASRFAGGAAGGCCGSCSGWPLWVGSLLLLGLPLVWVLPKTSLAPLVGLFEDTRKVFRRSGRILREDSGVGLMGFLYLAMGLVMGGLVVLPRLLLGTSILGANLLDERWRPAVVERLWIFETMSVGILLTAIAMSWWITLTFVYHDMRRNREGESLKRRISLLREKLAIGSSVQQ